MGITTGDDVHEPDEAGARAPYRFELTAGALCLDLVNTLGNRRGPEPLEEHLGTYEDLVEFARQAGTVGEAEAGMLRGRGAARPAEAARVLARAIALREALYGVFEAQSRGADPDPRTLAGLNAELGRALAHTRIERAETGYALGWNPPRPDDLDAPLWPVAHSAMEVLLDADPARLGECDSETCGFLFLDTTRNRSRRWCDTRVCGNRARVRAHRRRHAGGA